MSGSAGSHAADVLFEAFLERALSAYYRGEGHGGADAAGPRALDAWLGVPTSRRAFQDADVLPPDAEVLGVLEAGQLDLLGEGYHVITLVDPSRRFVLKYVKSDQGIAPLAPAETQPGHGEWGRDHGTLRMACFTPRYGSTSGPSNPTGIWRCPAGCTCPVAPAGG